MAGKTTARKVASGKTTARKAAARKPAAKKGETYILSAPKGPRTLTHRQIKQAVEKVFEERYGADA